MSRKGNKRSFKSRHKVKGQKKGNAFEGAMIETGNSSSRLDRVLAKCRTTGTLKLASFALSELPDTIFHLGEESDTKSEVNWWECEPIKILEAPHNQLTEIPSSITKFEELTTLNLQDNKLHTLLEDIADCEKLVKLNLSMNALTVLPEVFPETLTSLSLQQNKLENIPACLTMLTHLRTLDLSSNQLKSLPNQGRLEGLTKLNVGSNSLTVLPRWLSQCKGLASLNVEKNKIASMPDLSQLHKLTSVNVALNKLNALPNFSNQAPLITLEANKNALVNIDNILNQCNLLTLLLEGNALSELSPAIENLSKLKVLDVQCNNLEDIPGEFGRMESLKNFLVDGNALRKIQRSKYADGNTIKFKKYLLTRLAPDEQTKKENVKKNMSQSVEEALKSGHRTRTLCLQGFNLNVIPEDVWEVEGIKVLDLSQNKLSEATETLDDIAVFEDSLQSLILDKNKYRSFPMSLLSLPKLKKISFSFNQINALPRNIGSLVMLTELHLANNNFQQFPPQVQNMTNLTELSLSYNGLTSLPSLQGMRNLRTLHLRANKLTHIADGISRMQQLNYIDLQDNEMRQIPLELAACPALKILLIAGNPQVMISSVIVQKGANQVLQALRSKAGPGNQRMGAGRGNSNMMGGKSPNMTGRGNQNMMGGRSSNMMGRGNQNMMGGRNSNMMGRGNQNMGRGNQNMGRGNQNMMGGRSPNMMGRGNQRMMGRGMGRGSPNMMGRGMGQARPNMSQGNNNRQAQITELSNKIRSLEVDLKQYGLRKAQQIRLQRELEKTKIALKAAQRGR